MHRIFLPRHPQELVASEDFHPIPSIIGITTEEYCWIIPSVGPTPKPPGAREPIGRGGGGGGFHGSRPILPPARFSLTTQSVSNSDTQAGWTETVKDVLQETSAVMVRLLGTCPHGEGLLFYPKAWETHLTDTLTMQRRPDSLTHPGIHRSTQSLLPPCPASLPTLALPDHQGQMMPPEFGDLLMEEYIEDSEVPQALHTQFYESPHWGTMSLQSLLSK